MQLTRHNCGLVERIYLLNGWLSATARAPHYPGRLTDLDITVPYGLDFHLKRRLSIALSARRCRARFVSYKAAGRVLKGHCPRCWWRQCRGSHSKREQRAWQPALPVGAVREQGGWRRQHRGASQHWVRPGRPTAGRRRCAHVPADKGMSRQLSTSFSPTSDFCPVTPAQSSSQLMLCKE